MYNLEKISSTNLGAFLFGFETKMSFQTNFCARHRLANTLLAPLNSLKVPPDGYQFEFPSQRISHERNFPCIRNNGNSSKNPDIKTPLVAKNELNLSAQNSPLAAF